jgi:hypothetical protein
MLRGRDNRNRIALALKSTFSKFLSDDAGATASTGSSPVQKPTCRQVREGPIGAEVSPFARR